MREILFRAKTKNKHREWIIGLIGKIRNLDDEIEYYIIQDPEIENIWLERQIDPSTLEQYTGQIDKNGKKIFEGDIVSISGELKGIYTCVWEEHNFEYEFDNKTMSFGLACVHSDDIKVIGNIHDNPELLKSE